MSPTREYISVCVLSSLVLLSQVALALETSATAASQASATTTDGQTLVGAYVESLCPDSRRFFSRQLVPTNRELGRLFQVRIVPFGHARVLGSNKMVCQHGQRECDGNRKMACVLARAKNQSEAIETLGCMFEALDEWKECVKKHMPMVKSVDEIDACSKNDESYKMMIEAEKETGRVDYVPHLTLNGKHDDDIQSELEHSLKKLVCQQYRGEPKPETCKSIST